MSASFACACGTDELYVNGRIVDLSRNFAKPMCPHVYCRACAASGCLPCNVPAGHPTVRAIQYGTDKCPVCNTPGTNPYIACRLCLGDIADNCRTHAHTIQTAILLQCKLIKPWAEHVNPYNTSIPSSRDLLLRGLAHVIERNECITPTFEIVSTVDMIARACYSTAYTVPDNIVFDPRELEAAGFHMSGRTVERITKKPGSTIPAGYMLTVALMQYDDSDVKRMFARGQLAHLGARVIRRW